MDLLTGPFVRLRALEPADVELLYEWENDTSVWTVSNTLTPFSKFQVEEYIFSAQNDIYAAKQLRLMIVLHQEDNLPAGSIDLFDYDPVHLRAGVGILVREQFRNKGYAREALQILVKYAFTVLRMHQLYCNIMPGNTPSIRLFEQAGFTRCGTKRDWINEGGTWKEEWMYQLINHEN